MKRFFFVAGTLFAFLSIALGAFGAHYLKSRISFDMLNVFETAVRYQMYHAIALVIVGLLPDSFRGKWTGWAGWALIAGILLFSGSLYVLSVSGIAWIGAITPLGGLSFLVGWICLAMAGLSKKR